MHCKGVVCSSVSELQHLSTLSRNGSMNCVLQVAHSCKAKGAASCDVLPVDLSKSRDVEKFAKDVLGKHKQVDVLVNNAGMGAPGQNSPLSDPGNAPYGSEIRVRQHLQFTCACEGACGLVNVSLHHSDAVYSVHSCCSKYCNL